jgi:hypothetical protein
MTPYSKDKFTSCWIEAFAEIYSMPEIDINTASSILTEEIKGKGFYSSFDGKTLNGWWYLG